MRKGEKRQVVAKIIGYDDVTSFRDTIQQTLNALQKESEYVAAKTNIETRRAELLKLGGEIINTKDKLYKVLNTLLRSFDLGTEVTDDESHRTVRWCRFHGQVCLLFWSGHICFELGRGEISDC